MEDTEDMMEASPIEMEAQAQSMNETDESPINSEFDESDAQPVKKKKRSKELYGNEFGDFDMVDIKMREIKDMFMRLYGSYGVSFATSSTTSASSFDRRSQVTCESECSESSSKSALSETRRRVDKIWEEQLKENEIGVVSNEVDRYFMDALEKNVESFDILGWWKAVGVIKYKVLGAIAKDVLAIPISTVASESSFSTGGRVIDPFRCSLSPKMVEALICTQNWLRSSTITLHHVPTAEEMEFYEEIESEMSSASINMPPPKRVVID